MYKNIKMVAYIYRGDPVFVDIPRKFGICNMSGFNLLLLLFDKENNA